VGEKETHGRDILIVDDDPIVAESLAEHLAGSGFETATAMNAAEAKALLDGASQLPDGLEGRAPSRCTS
jgi:CheY-like chemotaxis protein